MSTKNVSAVARCRCCCCCCLCCCSCCCSCDCDCPSVCLVGVVQPSRAQKAHFIAQTPSWTMPAPASRSLTHYLLAVSFARVRMSQGRVRGWLPDWPKIAASAFKSLSNAKSTIIQIYDAQLCSSTRTAHFRDFRSLSRAVCVCVRVSAVGCRVCAAWAGSLWISA